jgi:UDP-N-acetylmuramoyl-tripeptide--D-alanyl-D-alanine ligase
MNPYKTVTYQLYQLQLENYDLSRFFQLIKKTFAKARQPARQALVWTLKARTVFVLALILQFFVAYSLAYLVKPQAALWLWLLFFYFLCFLFFLFLAVTTVFLWPLDFLLKYLIIRRARTKLASLSNLIVIGITGSYGKTTAKEVLAEILSRKYRVLKTPENINTPLGVAGLILGRLDKETQVFIVEMGAYQRGDIRALCALTHPSIGILTGINEAHLERFGGTENTIRAKFELVESVSQEGFVLLNVDDELVKQNYSSYVGSRKVFLYSTAGESTENLQLGDFEFFQDGSGIGFSLALGHHQLGKFKLPFFSKYILGQIAAGVIVGSKLGLNEEQLTAGIALLRPAPHRLQPIPSSGQVLVIDDSYNGNPAGVREAIAVLGNFRGKRKVYVTPGLVEMGARAQAVHEDIGRQLGGVADLVIFIRNSVTPFIASGLEKAGFAKDKVLLFDSALEAHAALPGILRPGDVVLFQNDWPDNYF